MKKKRGFKLKTGYYFFNIKTGYQNTTIVSRETKKEAVYAYHLYVKQKKDCEWLGLWDGKKIR